MPWHFFCTGNVVMTAKFRAHAAQSWNWKVVTKSLSSFAAISFVLCIGYGLLVPAFHATWLLEALLPGFKWLSLGSFVLGVVESALYGAWAGFLYSALFNYFARRADRTESRVMTARAA